MDKYVNATKMIEKIDEKIGSLKDKYGELPDCVEAVSYTHLTLPTICSV